MTTKTCSYPRKGQRGSSWLGTDIESPSHPLEDRVGHYLSRPATPFTKAILPFRSIGEQLSTKNGTSSPQGARCISSPGPTSPLYFCDPRHLCDCSHRSKMLSYPFLAPRFLLEGTSAVQLYVQARTRMKIYGTFAFDKCHYQVDRTLEIAGNPASGSSLK